MTQIVQITVKNLKAIHDLKVDWPAGSHLIITGGNNQGKTTLANLFRYIVDKKARPDHPLTHGEKEGMAKIQLDNGYQVEWHFSPEEDSVTVIDPDGNALGKNQSKILKELAGNVNFDVDAFLQFHPKKKATELQKIAGINLEPLEAKAARAEQSRLDAGRAVDQQRARALPYDQNLLNVPLVPPAEHIKRVAEMREHNSAITLSTAAYNQHLEVLNANLQNCNTTKAEILSLENQLAELNVKLTQKREESLAQAESYLAKLEECNVEYNSLISRVAFTPEQITAAEAEIVKYNDLRSQKEAVERLKKEDDELKRLIEIHEATKAEVAKVDEERREILSKANLPADGLTFTTSGEVLLNGVPFDDNSVSTSAKLIALAQIAFSQMGDVKLVHIDASLLDHQNLERMFAWANKVGCSLAIERVRYEGGAIEVQITEK